MSGQLFVAERDRCTDYKMGGQLRGCAKYNSIQSLFHQLIQTTKNVSYRFTKDISFLLTIQNQVHIRANHTRTYRQPSWAGPDPTNCYATKFRDPQSLYRTA